MKKWIRKVTAFLGACLLITSSCMAAGVESTAEDGNPIYNMTFRIHGTGKVKLENDSYGETVFESGEKTLSLTPGTYVKVTAEAGSGEEGQDEGQDAEPAQESVISVTVTNADGIELEPADSVSDGRLTREITVTEIDKVVEITFGDTTENSRGNNSTKMAKAATRAAGASEKFPEVGDKFTGSCTVKSVTGGNGHTVHGVTLSDCTGILSGEGDVEADCAQHSAAAPVAGMKYNYTYTITAVDKSAGKVTGSLYFVSQTQPATGEVDSEGYLIGYQALAGVFSIRREYNGRLRLQKISADTEMTKANGCYSLKNAKYGVYSDAECRVQEAVLTTKEDGTTDPVELPVGRYYVKELSAPAGYALDGTKYTVDVASDNTAVVSAKDHPQSAPVSLLLEKTDAQTQEAAPQGKASLADAYFTVKYYAGYYTKDPAADGVKPVRTWVMKTDQSGKIAFQEAYKVSGDAFYKDSAGRNVLPLGTVTIQETKAPEGYLMNDEVYIRQITPAGAVESVDTYNNPTVPEEVVRGDLELVKFSRDPEEDQDRKTPLEGICFEITSKTTGEKAEIITDENGYASTQQLGEERGGLAYDTYIVHEKNPPAGLAPVDDFEIAISGEGETLYYILEDQTVVSPVRLVKTDSTSGKTIPVAGAEFELLDAEKEKITMTTYYPEKEIHETFTTNAEGAFLLPERLPAGVYYFREIGAPEGYLLNKEDIRFTISESHEWDSPLAITFPDEPAKGKIEVIKTDAGSGEVLSGAEFVITAAEDIVTPDGTVRAGKGETVETITTDESGRACSGELFLGKYTVTESKQPAGYVRSESRWEVELSYKDQDTAVVTESVSVENVPTKFVIIKKAEGSDLCLPGVKFAFWKKTDDLTEEQSAEESGAEENDAEDAGENKEEEPEKEILTTGEDGTLTIEKLTPGTYCLQEIETVPGYLLDETVREFTVSGDGRINGEEVGIMTVENAVTRITQTKAVNADTGGQELLPQESRVTDTVSLENLQPGTEYMLRGVLMDKKTGKPLRENDVEDGAVLMSEKKFTATDTGMEVDVEFAFNAAAFAGRTIVVFEYLYQEETEISRHADLEELMQQLYVKEAGQQTGEKKEDDTVTDVPQTGDADEPLQVAAVVAVSGGAAAVLTCRMDRRHRKKKR